MPSVLIAGGGLVGSVNACLFAKKGWDVRVFESRPDPRDKQTETGKSINLALGHRAMATLDRIGLKKEVIELGVAVTKRRAHRGESGGTLDQLPILNEGDFVLTVNRHVLSELLIKQADTFENVKFQFGCKALKFDSELHKVVLETPHGQIEAGGDLILACDGAHSSIRRSLLKVPRFNFEQQFIEFGYMDLSAMSIGESGLERGVHNSWIRANVVVVAFVNRDDSLTVSVFAKFTEFERNMSDPSECARFFKSNFPEVFDVLGELHILETFSRHKPQAIISVRCSQHAFFNNLLLMGDAAHAMVPFSGQGVNCGFEDCLVLQEILEANGGNLEKTVREYSNVRTEDTNAMNRMAWRSYLELECFVCNCPIDWIQRIVSLLLIALHRFTPSPHLLVTFSRQSYAEIEKQTISTENFARLQIFLFTSFSFLFFIWFSVQYIFI